MWFTELNERGEELHSNGVLRGPGICIMDPGQAGAPNTPNPAPTNIHTAQLRPKSPAETGAVGGGGRGVFRGVLVRA